MSTALAWTRERQRRRAGAPFFAAHEMAEVRTFYAPADDAPPTPLHRLTALARALGLGEVLIKDETARFGLPAFKILGARYAIARLLAEPGERITDVACATAGNHGRAVAHAARARGLRAHVYVPAGTDARTMEALRGEGADVVVTGEGYDDTVRRMAREAEARGWTIVSDTSWEGYEHIPRWIMAGYTRLMDEAQAQWDDAPPDVVIVQAGVGSLAGAVAAWLGGAPGSRGGPGLQTRPGPISGGGPGLQTRPRLVIAEPIGSACVQASLAAGRRVSLTACAPTAMAGLRCAEVSPLAWRALDGRVDAAIGVSEELWKDAAARLAAPLPGDPAIFAGPSGACGVAAAIALMQDPALAPARDALALTASSRVMAIVTECSQATMAEVQLPIAD